MTDFELHKQSTLLDYLRSSLLQQEELAPRSEKVTRNNHYVPRFFQGYWGKDGVVSALRSGPGKAVGKTSTRGTMSENLLYTVPEVSNPNIFEKRRTLFEVPLSDALRRSFAGAYDLTDFEYGLLFSMMIHGSPEAVRFYRASIRDHAKASDENLDAWLEKSMASTFMIQSIQGHAEDIADQYEFELINTFEPLVLSDYPVIQLMEARQVHPLLGIWHPEASQMILPINPHQYVLATKIHTSSLLVSKLNESTINSLSLRSAQRVIIGKDNLSLTVTVLRENTEEPFGVWLPRSIPFMHMVPGAMVFFTEDGDSVRGNFWTGSSRTPPPVYADSGITIPS